LSKWISYTNEKLYLARRQWVIGQQVTEVSDRLACHQGMLLLMQQAYIGMLNELGETRKLRDKVQTLKELSEQSGFESEWIVQLRHLAKTPGSWLYELERGLSRMQAPAGDKGQTAVSEASVPGLIASSTEAPVEDGAFILGQMSAFAAQLREYNYQY
jgi:hypothetical protein